MMMTVVKVYRNYYALKYYALLFSAYTRVWLRTLAIMISQENIVPVRLLYQRRLRDRELFSNFLHAA